MVRSLHMYICIIQMYLYIEYSENIHRKSRSPAYNIESLHGLFKVIFIRRSIFLSKICSVTQLFIVMMLPDFCAVEIVKYIVYIAERSLSL